MARSGEPPPGKNVDPYGKLSLSFEPNVGQADLGVDYIAHGGGFRLLLAATETVLQAEGAEVRLSFAGGDKEARPVPRDVLPGRVNYLVSDPARHRSDVPTYARVVYEGLYEGIDVAYYGKAGQVEYDLVVGPGADPSRIRLAFAGTEGLRLEPDGDLALTVAGGELVQKAPVVFQDRDGRRQRVEAEYVLTESGQVGFRFGRYDRSRTLVIDPILVYSTYLGGLGSDSASDVAVDGSGSAYVVGDSARSSYDVVVSKLNPAGSALVYTTYLGGAQDDYGEGIEVDGAGAAYVSGWTASSDFPTAAAIRPTKAAGRDAFVAKLNPAGSALVYSTFLGGNGDDNGSDIAIDGAGNAYVTGTTGSTDFPTFNALQPASGGDTDAFVTKLHAAGSELIYSTYLGGTREEWGAGIHVDLSGSAVVVGTTESSNFPVFAPVQSARVGYNDAFVSRLDPTGSALEYSTYLGGTGYSYGGGSYSREGASAVAVDGSGNAYVTGVTTAYDFPTYAALFPQSGNGYDAFITKLTPTGSLVYSTYLGSEGSESGSAIAVDSSGSAYITGNVYGSIPVKDPSQGLNGGAHDAFVTKLSPGGSALVYSTYLGGAENDYGWGIAVDSAGAAYVVGDTSSHSFPTKGPVQPSLSGFWDMFVSKLSSTSPVPQLQGTTRYSDGTTTRSGPAGTRVAVSATGAVPNVAYTLIVSSDERCSDTLGVANGTPAVAGADGSIGLTQGTVTPSLPAGDYWICFRDDGNQRATAPVRFTVLPPPAIQGTTQISDGSCCPHGPPGTWVSAFALGARPGVAYRLVLSLDTLAVDRCANTAAVLTERDTAVRQQPWVHRHHNRGHSAGDATRPLLHLFQGRRQHGRHRARVLPRRVSERATARHCAGRQSL